MEHLKLYNKQDILSLTRLRRFETKLGERLQVLTDVSNIEDSINKSTAQYVLFGIPEDIGIKANLGMGGADSAIHRAALSIGFRSPHRSVARLRHCPILYPRKL